MKSMMSKCWLLSLAAMLCFALGAFAEQGSTRTQASVTPANGSTTISTAAVCDDFAEATNVGESWAVNVYRFSNISKLSTRRGNSLYTDLTASESSPVIQLSADLLGLLGLAIVFRKRLLAVR